MRAEPEPHAHGGAAGERGDREAGLPDARVQEGIETNPYAPPKARVEVTGQLGGVWREGKLVRIDRDGALPDRCVICNRPAEGYRVTQTLYWSPPAWKVGAWSTPFVVLGAGIASNAWWVLVLFWPTVILLVLANFFVRKSLRLELGLCPRHRRIRTVLGALSIAGMAGVAAAIWSIGNIDYSGPLLLVSLGGILLLMGIQSFSGLRRLRLKSLSGEHAWLARTGEPFRASLPEMPA